MQTGRFIFWWYCNKIRHFSLSRRLCSRCRPRRAVCALPQIPWRPSRLQPGSRASVLLMAGWHLCSAAREESVSAETQTVKARPTVRASEAFAARNGWRDQASLNVAHYTHFGHHRRRNGRSLRRPVHCRTRETSRRTARPHSITFCALQSTQRRGCSKSSCQFHKSQITTGMWATSRRAPVGRRRALPLCLVAAVNCDAARAQAREAAAITDAIEAAAQPA